MVGGPAHRLVMGVHGRHGDPPTRLGKGHPRIYRPGMPRTSARLRATGEGLKEHTHAKTRALAIELLNDWCQFAA